MEVAPVGIEVEGFKAHNCSCISCKTMCLSSPCFPTPEEVVRLQKMGFGSDLMFTMFPNLQTLEIYTLVAPKSTDDVMFDRCTFHNVDGLCELHELGLKPTEGRLAHHDQPHSSTVTLRNSVCETWKSELGYKLLKEYGGENYRSEIDAMQDKFMELTAKEQYAIKK